MGFLVYGKMQYYGKLYKAALKPLLVITDEDYILVDTGIGELPPKYKNFYKVDKSENLKHSLQKFDLSCTDISIVINTHLHLDHCGNNIMFENAVFYVQSKELMYAHNPHRFQKGAYIKELFDCGVSYKTIEGSCEISEGIDVIVTAGHTPGHQSVIIDTSEKKYIYCGDVCPLRENFELRNIVGILYNPVDALASIDKLRAIDGEHIFSHDNQQLILSVM
jgi:glyoxylase-like metal-dependent hydrolase (beta-lactamase superfamily II)